VFSIVSEKHDGSLHRAWMTNHLLYNDERIIIASNYDTVVTESSGNQWTTNEPAICYFPKDKWYNIVLLFTPNDYYYYCNICSPFWWEQHDVLVYIDYDIDVIVDSSLHYDVVDRDEYEQNRKKYRYANVVCETIERSLDQLVSLVETKADPFNRHFVERWSKQI